MNCPNCQTLIPAEDINVQKDIALCRACNKVHSLSQDLAEPVSHSGPSLEHELSNFDITNPPDDKTWVRQTTQGIAIGASAKSSFAYVFLVFILIFGGISGTVFAAFLFSGELETEMALFFIPFFLVDLIMLVFFLFTFFGRVEVTIDRYEGEVFVGALSFGWRKQFDVKAINKIVEGDSNVTVNNVRKKHIVMHTENGKIAFGSLLKNERRRFIYLALNKYFYQLNQKLGRN